MPFKSEAQRRKFAEMVKEGKIKQEVFNEWNSKTPKKIPERVSPKPSSQTVLKTTKKVKKI